MIPIYTYSTTVLYDTYYPSILPRDPFIANDRTLSEFYEFTTFIISARPYAENFGLCDLYQVKWMQCMLVLFKNQQLQNLYLLNDVCTTMTQIKLFVHV